MVADTARGVGHLSTANGGLKRVRKSRAPVVDSSFYRQWRTETSNLLVIQLAGIRLSTANGGLKLYSRGS